MTIPNCNSPSQICFYNDRAVTLVGRVRAEPNISLDKARYVVDITTVVGAHGRAPLQMNGKILLTTRIYPQYNYGDTLQIECKLQTPQNQDGTTFNYQKYLAKEGIDSLCSFPKSVSVVNGVAVESPLEGVDAPGAAGGVRPPSSTGNTPQPLWRPPSRGDSSQRLMSAILNLKSKVANQINSLWPEPESSLMGGLLYGSKSTLPADITLSFTRTGLTHIIAVSGFNITIIATVLMSLLIFVGLWRKQAYWIVLAVLFLFVLFTGTSGSVVRAAIMGAIVLTARQIGRLSQIGNVLVFTAAIMVAVNPYVLLWDAGFQLSFLATLGLVYVSPLLESKFTLKKEKDNQTDRNYEIEKLRNSSHLISKFSNFLISPFVQTLSAIIATLPLILYQFGRLSIVAPIVNVLILWTVPWLMLGGFIALIVSLLFFPLGQLIAWVTLIGLKYVIIVVEWFGGQSWAAAEMRVSLWMMVAMYVILIYVIARASRPQLSSLRQAQGRL